MDDNQSPTIYLCDHCDKPFTKEVAYTRHLKYCSGTRKRVRQRSCRACAVAKTKCTFEKVCARCVKRGVACVYDSRTVKRNADVDVVKDTTQLQVERDGQVLGELDLGGVPPLDDAHLFDAFEDTSFALPPQSFNVDRFDFPSWPPLKATWTRRGISPSLEIDHPLIQPNSNLLTILHMARPHARHNADLIMQSIRAFPTMMLRRETFPWFIHPSSQLAANPTATALPEALSTCMSIAQMFSARTPETTPFIWRSIRSACSRFAEEAYSMSVTDLAFAKQACMIYLVMCLIDASGRAHGLELLVSLNELFHLFKIQTGGIGSETEIASPSPTWGSWIFAEFRRRLASLWFLLGCVVSLNTGQTCDVSLLYRSLPLPAPKAVWEASSRETWEAEYEASRILQSHGLVTLGDLIDAQGAEYTVANARKLDIWNAGVDNLGSLLNLVGTMV